MTCVIFHKVICVLSSGRNPLRSSPVVLKIGLYPGRETKDDITPLLLFRPVIAPLS